MHVTGRGGERHNHSWIFDEAERWIAYRRGDLRIAANLSDRSVEIPLGGGGRVLA